MAGLHGFRDSHFEPSWQHRAIEASAAGEDDVMVSLMWIKMKSKRLSHVGVDAAVHPLHGSSLVYDEEIRSGSLDCQMAYEPRIISKILMVYLLSGIDLKEAWR